MIPPDNATTLTGAGAPRPRATHSVAQLLSDLASDTSTLVRQELALFRAELGRKLARAGQGAAALAIGGAIAFGGWLALLASATLGLSEVVRPWLAALIVGLASLVVGAGLLYFGKARFGPDAFALRHSLRSLREDAASIKERMP